MREICQSGSIRGMWKQSDGKTIKHRQTKGAATAMFYLMSPRHISTLRQMAPELHSQDAAILL
jgi:hypothetical protein